MPFRLWFQAPRRVLVLFVTITLVPAAALGWLGWRTLKQNWALDRQRETEGLELLADRISGALDHALADLQGRRSRVQLQLKYRDGQAGSHPMAESFI
jgi:hypothetical protein